MSQRAFERWDWACYVAKGLLTPAQRAALLVVVRHHSETETAFMSQATIAASVGIEERSVRRVLVRLQEMGLLFADHRPGKTTMWTPNFDWTPDTSVQGEQAEPRTSASGVDASSPRTHPGRTPDAPRTPVSYEGEGEREETSLSLASGATERGARESDEETNGKGTSSFPANLIPFQRMPEDATAEAVAKQNGRPS